MKSRKPLTQEPSRLLYEYLRQHDDIPQMPILDIACGFGRNGAIFVDKGYKCIFCDNDDRCINYINNGKGVSINGDIDKSLYETVNIDFDKDAWPFDYKSCGGIINVHYYNKRLISKFINSLCVNGFLYIETVSSRGGNYLELPEYKYIYNSIINNFRFIHYKENKTKQQLYNTATLKLLAIKIK